MEKAANKLLKSFFFKSRHGVMEHDWDKNMYIASTFKLLSICVQ